MPIEIRDRNSWQEKVVDRWQYILPIFMYKNQSNMVNILWKKAGEIFCWMTIYLIDFYDLCYDRYCAQRKGKKCRASLRLYPDGRLMPVVTEHSHPIPPINTRVYSTTNPNDLYYDVDNHEHIDLVTLIKDPNDAWKIEKCTKLSRLD